MINISLCWEGGGGGREVESAPFQACQFVGEDRLKRLVINQIGISIWETPFGRVSNPVFLANIRIWYSLYFERRENFLINEYLW